MNGQAEVNLNKDVPNKSTLWVDLKDMCTAEDIGDIGRVIITSGVWCNVYYLDDREDKEDKK